MAETKEVSVSSWTDDQDAALLKAIIQFKPVGMHKHFRMIAIRNYMYSQGVVGSGENLSVQDIWTRLESLYDLARLDDREDSVVADTADDQAENGAYWRDFELPRNDYEGLMWDRRLAPDGESSPDWSRRESTVAETDEPRSSPISVRGSGRGGRGRRGGRLSKLQNEIETERSSRRTSKAGSLVDEDQIMEDVDSDDDSTQSDEEEDEETDEQEDAERKWTAKRGGRGGRRGRGRRGRKRGG